MSLSVPWNPWVQALLEPLPHSGFASLLPQVAPSFQNGGFHGKEGKRLCV